MLKSFQANFKNSVIHKAQVTQYEDLWMFGSNPGNCLRALGTVGAVASLNMVVAT